MATINTVYFEPHLDEAKANARLIAAAPELLHALRVITTAEGQVLSSRALDIALAAIAKAQG